MLNQESSEIVRISENENRRKRRRQKNQNHSEQVNHTLFLSKFSLLLIYFNTIISISKFPIAKNDPLLPVCFLHTNKDTLCFIIFKLQTPVNSRYLKYLCNNTDDSPLYLFHNCDEDKKLQKKYTIPKFFREDYFTILKSRVRPPYRWLLVGPRRSGTKLHIDPLNTSAWNISLEGYKLWIIFPNKFPKWVLTGRNNPNYHQKSKEAIDYFAFHLPQVLKSEKGHLNFIKCLQGPGDTIFVPGGWWHAVLNITDTLAITQNYVNSVNFDLVWKSLRIERKMLAEFFRRTMKKKRHDIYYKIKRNNIKDKFVMYHVRL